MAVVKSFSVGEGDMYYINDGSDKITKNAC